MSGNYKQLDLDDVVAGMTLSEVLLDSHGDVLLPSGTVLTETTLSSLRRRGIDKLLVLSEDISEADLAAERERLQQRLDMLFRKCGKDGASGQLLQYVIEYRLGEKA